MISGHIKEADKKAKGKRGEEKMWKTGRGGGKKGRTRKGKVTDEVENGEEEGEEKQDAEVKNPENKRGTMLPLGTGKLIRDHGLQGEISKVQLHHVPSVSVTLSVLASPYREQPHNNLIITSQAN